MDKRSNATESTVDLMRDPHAPTALTDLARASAVANDVAGLLWVLRYADVERLAVDRRLHGVRLTIFDLMGVTEGPLRRWYGSLMFTNEGDEHGRLRRLVNSAFKPGAVNALRKQRGRSSRNASSSCGATAVAISCARFSTCRCA